LFFPELLIVIVTGTSTRRLKINISWKTEEKQNTGLEQFLFAYMKMDDSRQNTVADEPTGRIVNVSNQRVLIHNFLHGYKVFML
jgi:hypothetical protein